ncbi:hypothetical protein CNR22_13310 [Sphingobacteriaceae bacterium]|nr:hypothetical protein CNR22_13310 [Sphingobacteriaceae bacterium]
MKTTLGFCLTLCTVFILSSCKKERKNDPEPTASGEPVVVNTSFLALGAKDITNNSAVSGIYIAQLGSETVTEAGICWSESPDPTTASNKINVNVEVGIHAVNLTNLKNSTVYYLRSYIVNASGTSYGMQLIFHTKGIWTLNQQVPGKINDLISVESVMYASTESNGLYYSIYDGKSWMPSSLNNQKTRHLVQNEDYIYVGTSNAGVFYGKDIGSNWQQINTGLDSLRITGMTAYNENVYVLTGGEIYRKSNSESKWTKLTLANSITPTSMWVSEVGVSIYDSLTSKQYYWDEEMSAFSYAGDPPFSNPYVVKNLRTKLFLGSATGNYLSFNNGEQWQNITDNNLLNVPARAFTENLGSIYAAAGNNVYITGDEAIKWTPVTTGLPTGNSVVIRLLTHRIFVFAVSENNSVRTLYRLDP